MTMNTSRQELELVLLRLRAAHKENELDEALRTGWGWRIPRLQLWVLHMLISEVEDSWQLAVAV